jgi:PhoH-like ATPase
VSDQRRKVFVIDTSVLLYDKSSVHSFPGNDLIIPLVVLDELDRFKDKPNIVGENARYVNRFLDALRSKGSLHAGVKLDDNDQQIKVVIESDVKIPCGLAKDYGDNRIIGLAQKIIEETDQTVIVVTKDINFRVKCDALGIPSEDYYKDNIPVDVSLYSGVKTTILQSEHINQMHKEKLALSEIDDISLHPNEFVVAKSDLNESHSALAIHKKGFLKPVIDPKDMVVKVAPRNKEQKFAFNLLSDPEVPLVTLTGIAGSGKTFLTLMAGLNGVWTEKYNRIVITRPVVPVGRDLGFLPGDIDEKMSPWLKPIVDNFRDGSPDKGPSYFDMMKSRGQIEVAPLSFIRGRTFNDVYMIVDEAQNATIHELKTIITRLGTNSKLILLGDTDQIDTPYIDRRSNGLSIVVEKFKESWLAGHIRLPKGERSELATLASKIL